MQYALTHPWTPALFLAGVALTIFVFISEDRRMASKTPTTYPFQSGSKYYKRRTAKRLQYVGFDGLPTEDDVPAMVTRWGFQPSRYRKPKDAYLTHWGQWVEVASRALEEAPDGSPVFGGNHKGHYLVPIKNRWIRDRHRRETAAAGMPVVRVHVVNGYAVEVVGDGRDNKGRVYLAGAMPEEVHEFLGLPFAPSFELRLVA